MTTSLDQRCLDTFPQWLRSLGEDASGLASLLANDAVPEVARRRVAGGLNYLFKSLDLIPDGIEDLGYLDDAFVLRFAAASALEQAPSADPSGLLARLAGDAALVRELLGADADRLARYVDGLAKGAARGRTVDEIVGDSAVTRGFVGEVHAWAKSFEAPTFGRDAKNLVKLKSFLSEKLPA